MNRLYSQAILHSALAVQPNGNGGSSNNTPSFIGPYGYSFQKKCQMQIFVLF